MLCLDGAVAPLLAESAALRAWHGRAMAFLDKAGASLTPARELVSPRSPRSSDGASGQERALAPPLGSLANASGHNPLGIDDASLDSQEERVKLTDLGVLESADSLL
jgi:hypothetical protein